MLVERVIEGNLDLKWKKGLLRRQIKPQTPNPKPEPLERTLTPTWGVGFRVSGLNVWLVCR